MVQVQKISSGIFSRNHFR